MVGVSTVPSDYDRDPGRWRSRDERWLIGGDTHEVVAARIGRERRVTVLDVGCGQGRLRELLPGRVSWFGLDASPTQLQASPHRPLVLGDATHLPFPDETFDAVAALWMLYHLADPRTAITEAARVLRRDGLFAACTSARTNDPELSDGYPRTTFDAEEAPAVVESVFGGRNVEVEPWDARLVELADRDAVARYTRSHFLPPEIADRVTTPLLLTKRGVLVWARKHRPGGHGPS
jgi:SAM-dependent methyltransferase